MKKILIVNNDIDTMSLLKSWLERKEYKVKYTGNGEEVPHIIHEFSPDLVLVDILQHHVSEKLKSDERTKNIPVIIMTGYAILDQIQLTFTADDVIEKPFDPKMLDKKIGRFLKKTG